MKASTSTPRGGKGALEKAIRERGVDDASLQCARHTAEVLGCPLLGALVARGALSEDDAAAALSEATGLPVWNGDVELGLLGRASPKFCRNSRVVPVREDAEGRVVFATATPEQQDVASALAVAVGAEIILEVASPQAIVRGLQPIHAMEMPSLASALEPRENEEPPPVRLANLLLGKLAVGEITAARLRVGPGTELVGRGPGGTFDVGLLPDDKLVAPLPMELGVRLAHMAGMELAPQLGSIAVRGLVATHGGKETHFDVTIGEVDGGFAVVVTPALVRSMFVKSEEALQASLMDAANAIDADDFRTATELLAGAERTALATDGPGGRLMATVHWERGRMAAMSDDLVGAARHFDAMAACHDLGEMQAIMATWESARALLAAGEGRPAAARAEKAHADMVAFFGGPTPMSDEIAAELRVAAPYR